MPNVTYPYGNSNTYITDKLLENSYQTVKFIAQNMHVVKHVSDNLKWLSTIKSDVDKVLELQVSGGKGGVDVQDSSSPLFEVTDGKILNDSRPKLGMHVTRLDPQDLEEKDLIPLTTITGKFWGIHLGHGNELNGYIVSNVVGYWNKVSSHALVYGNLNELSSSTSTVVGSRNTLEVVESIVVGNDSTITYTGGMGYNVVIGNWCTSKGEFSTALGSYSQALGNMSVALGSQSRAIEDNVCSVGWEGDDINSPIRRRIINVANGTKPTDAVTKGQMETAIGNSSDILDEKISNIQNSISNINADIVTGNTDTVTLSGSGSINDVLKASVKVQGTPDNILKSASSGLVVNPRSSMHFLNKSNGGKGLPVVTSDEGLGIGTGTVVNGDKSIAIGPTAKAIPDSAVALGSGSEVTTSATDAVALGSGSKAESPYVVSVGNSVNKRRVVNVKDATDASDAVTLGQLEAKLADSLGNVDVSDKVSKTGDTVSGVLRFQWDYPYASEYSPYALEFNNESQFMGVPATAGIGIGMKNNKMTWYKYSEGIENEFLSALDATGHHQAIQYTALGSNYFSSRRLKTDIKELKYGLVDVLRLAPVSFQYASKPELGVHTGFIAEDVQKVIPEAVREVEAFDGSGLALGLDINKLVPVLVSAIQDLSERLEKAEMAIQRLSEEL